MVIGRGTEGHMDAYGDAYRQGEGRRGCPEGMPIGRGCMPIGMSSRMLIRRGKGEGGYKNVPIGMLIGMPIGCLYGCV